MSASQGCIHYFYDVLINENQATLIGLNFYVENVITSDLLVRIHEGKTEHPHAEIPGIAICSIPGLKVRYPSSLMKNR